MSKNTFLAAPSPAFANFAAIKRPTFDAEVEISKIPQGSRPVMMVASDGNRLDRPSDIEYVIHPPDDATEITPEIHLSDFATFLAQLENDATREVAFVEVPASIPTRVAQGIAALLHYGRETTLFVYDSGSLISSLEDDSRDYRVLDGAEASDLITAYTIQEEIVAMDTEGPDPFAEVSEEEDRELEEESAD